MESLNLPHCLPYARSPSHFGIVQTNYKCHGGFMGNESNVYCVGDSCWLTRDCILALGLWLMLALALTAGLTLVLMPAKLGRKDRFTVVGVPMAPPSKPTMGLGGMYG